MKAIARQRSHSIAFKRQVAQEFIARESLYALSKRHDISRQLIRVWVEKYEAGALDEDAQAADLLQEYEAKIAALERMAALRAARLIQGCLICFSSSGAIGGRPSRLPSALARARPARTRSAMMLDGQARPLNPRKNQS
jgi:transposase-like protein